MAGPIEECGIQNPNFDQIKDIQKLDAEVLFEELKKNTTKPTMLGDNQTEYRFGDIRCPENTAVYLMIDYEKKYLHANIVEMEEGEPLYLTQYPYRGSNFLFWKLAMKKSNLIVDLMRKDDLKNYERKNYPTGELNLQPLELNPIEENKLKELSIQESFTEDDIKSKLKDWKYGSSYIDEVKFKEVLGFEMEFDYMRVTFKNKTVVLGKEGDPLKTVRYNYQVEDRETGNKKNVSRFNFEGWRDYGGTSVDKLKELVEYVDSTIKDFPKGTIPIVHCLAGVGRSGTFATARTLVHLAKDGKLNNDNFREILFKIILKGREQRGPLFVQRCSQLQTLIELGKKLLHE